MLKVNKRHTRKRREICRSGVFISNFEYILHLYLVLLLQPLNMYIFAGWQSSLFYKNCKQYSKIINRTHMGLISSYDRSTQQTCSLKKLFLKISQNSQENTCARVSFLMKLQAKAFVTKETLEQDFSCEFCEIFKNTFTQNTFGQLLLLLKVQSCKLKKHW